MCLYSECQILHMNRIHSLDLILLFFHFHIFCSANSINDKNYSESYTLHYSRTNTYCQFKKKVWFALHLLALLIYSHYIRQKKISYDRKEYIDFNQSNENDDLFAFGRQTWSSYLNEGNKNLELMLLARLIEFVVAV